MIKFLVIDVDGTLTDGKIYFSERGEVFKAFNVKDGLGLKEIAVNNGITPIVITARQSKFVTLRMKELGIKHVYQGVSNKLLFLKCLANELGADFSEMAYIGDDVNDLECMEACGISACPSDSVSQIKLVVDYVCKQNGGEGAVREFIDELISKRRL